MKAIHLYEKAGDDLEAIEETSVGKEALLRKLIENNLGQLFGLEVVKREFKLSKKSKIDTLAFDEKKKRFVIIEYKKQRTPLVIDQGVRYLREAKNKPEKLLQELFERLQMSYRRREISETKLMVFAPKYDQHQLERQVLEDEKIELWYAKCYQSGHFTLSSPNANLPNVGRNQAKKKPKKKESAKKPRKTVLEASLTKKLSSQDKRLWRQLRQKLLTLPGTRINIPSTSQNYIGLKRKNLLVCRFLIINKKIKIKMRGGTVGKEETIYRLNDLKKVVPPREMEKVKHEQVYHYVFDLIDDIDYVFSLIKQRYDNM